MTLTFACTKAPSGRTDAECCPVGDQDLAIGIIGKALLALKLGGDGLAQGRLALVVGVTRAAIPQARIAASTMCAGVGVSGCPRISETTDRPCA